MIATATDGHRAIPGASSGANPSVADAGWLATSALLQPDRAPDAGEEGVLVRELAVDRVGDRAEMTLLESWRGGVEEVGKRVPDAPGQRGWRQRRERVCDAGADEGLVNLAALHGLDVARQDPHLGGRGVTARVQLDCGLDLGVLESPRRARGSRHGVLSCTRISLMQNDL